MGRGAVVSFYTHYIIKQKSLSLSSIIRDKRSHLEARVRSGDRTARDIHPRTWIGAIGLV